MGTRIERVEPIKNGFSLVHKLKIRVNQFNPFNPCSYQSEKHDPKHKRAVVNLSRLTTVVQIIKSRHIDARQPANALRVSRSN